MSAGRWWELSGLHMKRHHKGGLVVQGLQAIVKLIRVSQGLQKQTAQHLVRNISSACWEIDHFLPPCSLPKLASRISNIAAKLLMLLLDPFKTNQSGTKFSLIQPLYMLCFGNYLVLFPMTHCFLNPQSLQSQSCCLLLKQARTISSGFFFFPPQKHDYEK